jgi:lipopolysaccharide biosynthesis protein
MESSRVKQTNNIKVLAIHLPQFHPIPENDEWWGKGFTEWTNVRKAKPLFPGHHQPRIPADLGYYDLRSPEARAAQADLARSHGIDGFCYYHYWFNGRRLLDIPVREIIHSQQPDFPFCLFWANETWSRRWLGEERDVLIEQTYSKEDNIVHARYLASVFREERYIRLDGRPLFLIYRPTHIPVLAHFISTLRECSRAAGAGDPFLLGCSSHAEGTDMRTLGMDGTMDFQPKLGFLPEAFEDKSTPERLARNRALGVDSTNLRLYDAKDFRQRIEDFRDQLDYPVYPSVFVSWDNTPRRGENGIVLLNNSPEDFAKSLDSAKRYVNSPKFQGGKLVFINAWNEWAEGNYLEPDMNKLNAYLNKCIKK